MSIVFIDCCIHYEDQETLEVEALVEDAVVVRRASWDEPEELGAAMCATSVSVAPGDWPDDDLERIAWLEACQPEWTVIGNGRGA